MEKEENWRVVSKKKDFSQPTLPPEPKPYNKTPYNKTPYKPYTAREGNNYKGNAQVGYVNSTHRGDYSPRGGYNPRGSNNNSPRGSPSNTHKKKKPYIVIPDYESIEEEDKYKIIISEFPHIKMPGQIRRIGNSLNIDGFADKMLCDEWIEFQKEGWAFEKIIKPDTEEELPEGDEYELRELSNRWGDYILFKKI